MTLVMAAVQLGYSTDREALSDTTMGAACHNTDALTGGTAGMLLPCLQATGMEGWMNGRTDWEKDRSIKRRGGYTRSAQPSHDLIQTNYNQRQRKVHLQQTLHQKQRSQVGSTNKPGNPSQQREVEEEQHFLLRCECKDIGSTSSTHSQTSD